MGQGDVVKEKIEDFNDPELDKSKQEIIRTFKQAHLINAYARLNVEKRADLLT